MSVVAAKIEDGKIYIAADSMLQKNNTKRTSNFKKLVNKSNGIIVGGCGSAEELCLFFNFAEKHTPSGTDVSDVINYIKDFIEFKQLVTHDDSAIDNEYLIVYKGHLFETCGLFVQEVTDYTAIGDGEQFALAALHLGHSVTDAVKVACDLCSNVSEPISYYFVNIPQDD